MRCCPSRCTLYENDIAREEIQVKVKVGSHQQAAASISTCMRICEGHFARQSLDTGGCVGGTRIFLSISCPHEAKNYVHTVSLRSDPRGQKIAITNGKILMGELRWIGCGSARRKRGRMISAGRICPRLASRHVLFWGRPPLFESLVS